MIHTRRFVAALAVAASLAWSAGAPSAQPAKTSAAYAILIDAQTGAVLLAKDADQAIPPASMSKLMTLYMLFEKLADGRLALTDALPVSQRAWRTGGSKMFVAVNSRVSVEDLIRGIVVQSGNDACVVVAEGLASSEAAFSEEMTRKARQLGMTNSTLKNASGWPEEGHLMSVRDLATLALRLIKDFPQYYGYFAEKDFTYNNIRQGNRNPLLYKALGADGLKTGHIDESGYGLVASAARGGRRLILVVSGFRNVNERSREAERLLEWGFREFDNYKLFAANEVVTDADVWLGVAPKVPLQIKDELVITLAKNARRGLKVAVVYDGPLASPIEKGKPVAKLSVSAPDSVNLEIPLHTAAAVDRLSATGRISAAVNYLLWGAAAR
ncbi:MAG: D-alanyl-D-alanine carboxypeptidase [Alphaproteobacteria bacterium]|nr:D-alanyl-D-alanine carboxypeptidase [Alphaproteobacteria bacterium]